MDWSGESSRVPQSRVLLSERMLTLQAGTKRAAQEGADFMREQGKRAMDAAKKARNRD